MTKRVLTPLAIFVFCAVVYVLLSGQRAFQPSSNNHFVYLAESFLHGQLHLIDKRPPGFNDWALYEGKWFVSFPPLPAVLILPLVAIFGRGTLDTLFWAVLAGAAPALLFLLLQKLSERGHSARSTGENLALTALFAFGTVFFYSAVQGSVWFSAHVVASSLIILYLFFGLDAQRPLLAGLCLSLSFMTRTTTALLAVWFALEAMRVHRSAGVVTVSEEDSWVFTRALTWLRGTDAKQAGFALLWFALPIAATAAISLWYNAARFESPFVFGHEYLQIRWLSRIEKWGLFSYHYFAKNLAVMLASLPWFSREAPHVKVSLHGLALWVTTPNLFWLLWPKRMNAQMVGLYGAAMMVGLLNLSYQNSGWIQFGYRFALDYMPLLFVLLALGARRFFVGFYACAAFAVVVNLFGALTFDRAPAYYDNDNTQNRMFQPD